MATMELKVVNMMKRLSEQETIPELLRSELIVLEKGS